MAVERRTNRPVERPKSTHEAKAGPDKHIAFARRVNGYPEEAQEVVTSLSSMLLEPDVAEKIKRTPTEIKSVIGQLTSTGLSEEEVAVVLDYFALPDPFPKDEKDQK
jgi:hypothetical protein